MSKGFKNTSVVRHGGFSLLEIMAVVVIMGLLVGTVAVAVRGNVGTARKTRIQNDLVKIHEQVIKFQVIHDRFPSDDEGLEILKGDAENGIETFISNLADDPWGNAYGYQNQESDKERPFIVVCYGSDGLPGGENDAKDTTNWDFFDN